jgi:outer membrane receptor protein involved in Fe transport
MTGYPMNSLQRTQALTMLAVISASFAAAQTSHTLAGLVVDQSGGAIVGATVTLRAGSRMRASATTDSRGQFILGAVPEGRYQIQVEKNQFERALVDVGVGTAEVPPLRIELRVASVNQRVEVVHGTSEDLPYTVDRASTATKTETPILETPFSVEVVPHQVLDDQQAIRLSEVTRNVSGVQTNFGYGSLYEAFALRGFETNVTLRDGERASGGIGRSSVDLANVEDVEVLKGPAAMLYGRLEPGGMINVITKKPLTTPHYSLQQQFGSYNLFRTTLDATGPILQDGSLLYRAIYSYFSADQFMVHHCCPN